VSHTKQAKDDFKFVDESVKDQINQSTYCDYNEAFTGYDQVRQPHGLDTIVDILRRSKVPMDKQNVLEGGFGTGAYLDQIRHHVQTIDGVEGSEEGIQQTLQKVENAANVLLQLGNILQLSFPDNSFHAYMVNQVLHHLDSGNNFQAVVSFLKEAHRVLKHDGRLILNTCSHEQLDPDTGSYWHYKYISRAAYAIQKYYIRIEELEKRLESMGFVEIRRTLPSERIFSRRYYEDPSIALKPGFSKGDSTYSFLSESELEASNLRLREAIEDGSVYEEMNRAASRAEEIGEAVIVSARKI
jgi:ubiquinone/menaquinone biosynthesis C-methylase UbiE